MMEVKPKEYTGCSGLSQESRLKKDRRMMSKGVQVFWSVKDGRRMEGSGGKICHECSRNLYHKATLEGPVTYGKKSNIGCFFVNVQNNEGKYIYIWGGGSLGSIIGESWSLHSCYSCFM